MQISAKMRRGADSYLFFCPGCDSMHRFRVGGDGKLPQWTFDGNVERPTFSPSLRLFTIHDAQHNRLPDGQTRTLCHLFVKAGMIEFCGDSPHALAGKTVPMPDLPDYARGDKYGDGNP